MKKPRGDAKLKTLPDALQADIFLHCKLTDYLVVKSWLQKEKGILTSTRALSDFYSWYPLSRRLEQAAGFADQLKEQLASMPSLQLDAEKLSTVAQVAFEARAMQEQDPKLYVSLAKLRLKRGDQVLNERKVKLLEAKAALADQGKHVAENSDLSPEEQLSRFKQIFGGK